MNSQLIPLEITHPSGLQFRVNLTPQEVHQFETDESYADQLVQKYSDLYQSGFVNASGWDQEIADSEDAESECQENIAPESRAVKKKKRTLTVDDEEILIRLVSERRPLFDFRLPLKERGRDEVRSLWQEVIKELNVDVSVEAISKKWKNLRDSFIRVRGNIKKKIASGSSAEEKLIGEKLKKSHRNYDLLLFLEDTLSTRRTSTNLEIDNDDIQMVMTAPYSTETPTSRASSRQSNNSQGISTQDRAFLEAIKNVPTAKEFSPTENICLRLAAGLEKLPPRVKNKLEIEFLTRLIEMENKYLYNEIDDD